MNKHKILSAFVIVLLSLCAVSCSDDDDVKTYQAGAPIAAPQTVTLTKATISSLSFEWDAVPDAVLYGYELTSAAGKRIVGGTTSETTVTLSKLSLYTDYTLSVVAMPAVGQKATLSAPQTGYGKTKFYDQVVDEGTIYTSYLRDAVKGHTYKGTINEDRSYDGYQEGWFGIFTIKGFYGSKGDLTFRVNRDENNTITVLHADYSPLGADEYDDKGWAKVATGYSIPTSQKFLYIDESSSSFDPEHATLTYTARLAGEPNTETIDW